MGFVRKPVLVLLVLAVGVTLLLSTPIQPLRSVSAFPAPAQVMPTLMVMNVSSRVIFVGENFTVRGFLTQQNGIVLSGKVVTVSWGNQSVRIVTDWRGRFVLANVSFPIGFPQRNTRITAGYSSTDACCLSSSSYVDVQVAYRSSTLEATVTPDEGRPSDRVRVSGLLAATDGKPLQDREITIQLDGVRLGAVLTDGSGSFTYTFIVPNHETPGSHMVLVSFNPTRDASSNATLPLLVEPGTVTTMPAITMASMSRQQNVSVYSAFTFNASVVGIITTAILLPASVVLFTRRRKESTKTLGPKLLAGEPPTPAPKPAQVQRIVSTPPPTPLSIGEVLSRLNLEKDYPSKVTRAYYLAQELIKENVGIPPPETTETQREYCDRVVKAAPYITEPLDELSVLFEMAEYTGTIIDATLCRRAVSALTKLFQDLETRKESSNANHTPPPGQA